MDIYRSIFHAICLPQCRIEVIANVPLLEDKLRAGIANQQLLAASLFSWENHMFFYCEHIDERYSPSNLLADIDDFLVKSLSFNTWNRMWDIFHYYYPTDEKQWKRRIPNKTAIMRVNRLLPHKFSSYIYYHFQRQEERLGEDDKYGLICQDNGLMVFYQEEPKEIEKSPVPGLLKTNNTPIKDWQKLMKEHFVPWEEYHEPWLPISCLINLVYDM